MLVRQHTDLCIALVLCMHIPSTLLLTVVCFLIALNQWVLAYDLYIGYAFFRR